MEITRGAGHVSPIWFSNAIILGLLLSARTREWPWLIGAGAMANLGANMRRRRWGNAPGLGFTAVNMLEAVFAAILIRGGEPVGMNLLTDRKYVARFFFFGVLLAPGAGRTRRCGAGSFRVWRRCSAQVYWRWFAADALGIALVVPLILFIGRHNCRLSRLFPPARQERSRRYPAHRCSSPASSSGRRAIRSRSCPMRCWCLAAFRLGPVGRRDQLRHPRRHLDRR